MNLTYARWRAEPIFGRAREIGPHFWLAAFYGDPRQGAATEVSMHRTPVPLAPEYWELRATQALPVIVNGTLLQTSPTRSTASHCALFDREWGGNLVLVVTLDRQYEAGAGICFLPGKLTVVLAHNVETVDAALQREQRARAN